MSQSNLTRRDVIGGAVTLGLATGTGRDEVVYAAPGTVDEIVLTQYFLNFSEAATGFSRSDLESTGQGATYFATARDVLGGDTCGEFLQAYHDNGLDAVLSSPKLGQIARNVIKLWYTATWERFPRDWQDAYGKVSSDTTFIVSADAYTTGLLWQAIGVNPPGANAPGYGTWSDPPTVI
jgi:hypothetical protein